MNFRKYVVSLIKANKFYFVSVILLIIITSLFRISYEYKVKNIIDSIQYKNSNNLFWLLFLFALYQLIYHFLGFVKRVMDIKYVPSMFNKIVEDMYKKTVAHSLYWFDSKMAGQITSKIQNFAKMFCACNDTILGALGNILTILIGMIFVINITIWPVVITFGWLTICIPILIFIANKQKKIYQEYHESEAEMFGVINDSISNMFGVKVVGNLITEWELKLFPSFRKRELLDIKGRKFSTYISDNVWTVCSCTIGIIQIYLLAMLYKNGKITAGDFAFIAMMVLQISSTTNQIIEALLFTMIPNVASMEAAFSIIDQKIDVEDKPNATVIGRIKGKIEFEEICFQYPGGSPTLKNFNLLIPAGQKIAIIGPSGGGKSTIIKSLLRYIDLASGVIKIDDYPINDITQESLRKNISIIPQDISMFHRTVLENLKIAKPDVSFEEIVEACKKARVHDDIMKMEFGYNSVVGERGLKISGGQRQRIAFARAILKNAPILVLDEATSALDSETEHQIQLAIDEVLSSSNFTVIAIAHRLSTIKDMDRIIVIKDGYIIEDGSFNELYNKEDGYFSRLWKKENL